MPTVTRQRPPATPKDIRSPVRVNPVTGEVESRFIVRPPGWQEFIKIDPILGTSEVDRQKRKRNLAIRITGSPTPHIVKGLATVMTALDDIQDGFVTASVVGRVLVKFFPRLAPIVGPVATVADLLNAVGLSVLPLRLYFAKKAEYERILKQFPYTYRRRLRATLRTGKIKLGWGEVFQILQTSANVVDIGVELGAAIGYATDLLFGTIRGADMVVPTLPFVSEAVDSLAIAQLAGVVPHQQNAQTMQQLLEKVPGYRFKTLGVLGVIDRTLKLPPGSTDVKIQQAYNSIWKAILSIPEAHSQMPGLFDDLTSEEHLSLLYALVLAHQWMADLVHMLPTHVAINDLLDRYDIEAPPVRDPETAALVREFGQDPLDPRLPVDGNPRKMPFREFLAHQTAAWKQTWPVWVSKIQDPQQQQFAYHLLDLLARYQIRNLEGPTPDREESYTPQAQALLNLLDLKLDLPPGATMAQLEQFLTLLSSRLNPPLITKLTLEETLSVASHVFGSIPR